MDRPLPELGNDVPVPAPSSPPRQRRGRQRGFSGPGEHLIPRLGPASPESAPFHNPAALAPVGQSPPAEDTQLADFSFVALDCETTGHFPHRMVELGAVRFFLGADDRPPEPRISLESLVHTADHINPYARRVHGINSSMLGGAPTLHQVAAAFADLAQGSVLIEHSADGFDTRLVAKALGRPLDNHHLDTSRVAGFLFQLKDTIGLERLCERLEVTHRQPHYALADAEATADCFVRLVRLGQEEFGWKTLGDLISVGTPPPPRILPKPRIRRPLTPAAAASGPTPNAPNSLEAGTERAGRRRRRGGRGRRSHSGTAATSPSPPVEPGVVHPEGA
ncbi:MAG TPA: 3'-5' exonuclease [Candidatus Dormibacteraeota bacterium]|nr:3'-5' exonuclease [Candidatus Dormibacteraeota bacterium]